MTDDKLRPPAYVSNFYLWSIVVLGSVFGCLFACTQDLRYDEIQLLHKGTQLARHLNLVPFGNVVTGGLGHSPGILTSLLVGIPMMVVMSPISPVVLVFILHFISLYLYANLTREIFGRRILIIVLLFYWLSVWHTSKMILWNPSYLFFLSTIHLWSSYHSRSRKSAWHTFSLTLAIGAALQVHSSWVILALLSTFLYWRGLIRIHWPAFIAACLIILAMLIPYFIDLFAPSKPDTIIIASDAFIGRGLIYGYPLMKGLFYWIRYASTYFSSDIFTGTTYGWMPGWLASLVSILMGSLKWVLAMVTLVVSCWANFELLKKAKQSLKRREFNDSKDWLQSYACWTFVSVFIAVAASPITTSYWHLLIVFPQAILPLLFFWDRHEALLQLVSRSKPILTGFVVVVSLISFFGAMSSVRHDYKIDVHSEFLRLDKEGRLGPPPTSNRP